MFALKALRSVVISAVLATSLGLVPGCSAQRPAEERVEVGTRPTRAEAGQPASDGKAGPSEAAVWLGVLAAVIAIPVVILVAL